MSEYYPVPSIIENDGRVERQWDIYSRLLKDRIIFIGTSIYGGMANAVIAQMLLLQMEDPKKDIQIYINSPGGSISDGMAIYDTMRFLSCDIKTYCMGMSASMSAVILAAGTPGKRYALPHSQVMIHQPTGGATGQTTDISIAAREILRWKHTLNEVLSEHTKQPVERIERDSDRDFFLTAQQAKEYGIVDHVIEFRAPKAEPIKK
ncbi:MAG: ATP-dependent Clp protease proteolytic subunit [Verrucomicrobiota bacterium]|nr:ATP-dependent Clp protease proteolytic subunit [Verrucomicrobiota bacterium]